MAWRSSGTSNDELVDNLKRFGVIQSDTVERAFRSVDRRFFVPQDLLDIAHSDQPLRDGNIHISAPHIYGCIVEALDVAPSMSFLNIGSGTGYFSAIVGHILGPTGSSFGVEIHKDNVEHCLSSMERWEAAQGGQKLPYTKFVHGNGLHIDLSKGEGAIGFDRIYVGASITAKQLNEVVGLLQVGGILVGPVGDELIKVVRVKKELKKKTRARKRAIFHSELPELSDEFSKEVISGVIFAPLLKRPSISTVLESRVWSTSAHSSYPHSFRTSCKELLLCSIAPTAQPMKRQEPINTASLLPKSLWLEILSYTHRGWFENPSTDAASLRRRVHMLETTVKQSQKDHHETKRKLRMAEREADRYRALAAQYQARLEELNDSRSKSARTSYLPVRAVRYGRVAEFFDRGGEDTTVDETVEETLEEEPEEESDSDGIGLPYSDDEEDSSVVMNLSVTDEDSHVQPARRVSIAEAD